MCQAVVLPAVPHAKDRHVVAMVSEKRARCICIQAEREREPVKGSHRSLVLHPIIQRSTPEQFPLPSIPVPYVEDSSFRDTSPFQMCIVSVLEHTT